MPLARYRHSLMRTALTILGGKVLGLRRPLYAQLATTYRCNLRCAYCDVWDQPVSEGDTRDMLRIVGEIGDFGVERLSIAGGEPMLRPDAGEIVRHAKSRGMTVNMLTNGINVPRRVDELRNLDFLSVSLDGRRDVHDAARGAGSFDRAVRAIDAARDAGIAVWTETVLTRDNLGEIDFVLDFAESAGVRAAFQPVSGEMFGSRNADRMVPPVERFREAMNALIRAKIRGRPAVGSLKLYRFYRDFWNGASSIPDGTRKGAWHANRVRCFAGDLFCSVTPDGGLHACFHRQGGRDAPNVLREGFAAAFARLKSPQCGGCWCDSFVEGNFVFNLDPGVIASVYRTLRMDDPPPALAGRAPSNGNGRPAHR